MGPLSITLYWSRDLVDRSVSIAAFDTFILPNLRRLKELNIDDLPISTFLRLVDVPPDSLCSLESMRFDPRSEKIRDPHYFSSVTAFHNAVKLTTLTLNSRSRKQTPVVLNLPIPWSQLTSLLLDDIAPLSVVDVHCVLLKCFHLKKLFVEFNDDGESFMDHGLSGKQLNLPHLQHVELKGRLSDGNSITGLNLPWEQLITLEIDQLSDTPFEFYYQILQRCQCLNKLSIRHYRSALSNFRKGFALTLSQLTRLDLSIKENFVFDLLILPALKSLHIHCYQLPLPFQSISDMIIRSKCSLSVFTHYGAFCDPLPALDKLLSLMPSVTEFRAPSLILSPPFIQRIVTGEVLPRLTKISCGLRRQSLMRFVELLERRAKPRGEGGSGASVLWNATCWIDAMGTSTKLIEAARARMETLNTAYGTGFTLELSYSM